MSDAFNLNTLDGLPLLTGTGYSRETYEWEKREGIRRPTGAMKLTKLSGKHLRAILLHVNGRKNYEIAAVLGMSNVWVSTVLSDPLARAEIETRHAENDRTLLAKAMGVVHDSMEDKDPAIKLRAADMVFKSHGKYAGKGEGGAPSAEDVVQRMLQIAAERGGATLTVAVGAAAPASWPERVSAQQGVDPVLTVDVEREG